jgi:hypothetical protein
VRDLYSKGEEGRKGGRRGEEGREEEYGRKGQ